MSGVDPDTFVTLVAQRKLVTELKARVRRERQELQADAKRLEASLAQMLAPHWRRDEATADEYVLTMPAGGPDGDRDAPPPTAGSLRGCRPLSAARAASLRPTGPPSALQQTLRRPALLIEPADVERARQAEAARQASVRRTGRRALRQAGAGTGSAGPGLGRPLSPMVASLTARGRRVRGPVGPGAGAGGLGMPPAALRSMLATRQRAAELLHTAAGGMPLEEAEALAAAMDAGAALTPTEVLAARVAAAVAGEDAKLEQAAALIREQ